MRENWKTQLFEEKGLDDPERAVDSDQKNDVARRALKARIKREATGRSAGVKKGVRKK